MLQLILLGSLAATILACLALCFVNTQRSSR